MENLHSQKKIPKKKEKMFDNLFKVKNRIEIISKYYQKKQ
jgi:hypothetical protein